MRIDPRSLCMHRPSGVLIAATAATLALTTLTGATVATASTGPKPGADPAVITDWNATAVATVVGTGRRLPPEAFIEFAHVQLAVYNAVVGIERRFSEYKWNARGPRGASSEAAAAAAAHRVLLVRFPESQAALDSAYAASLARVPDGDPKAQGVRFGERAAARILELRAGDGFRDPSVVYTRPPAPGVWRPTPPAFAPFFGPWLAKLRPFALSSPSQFRVGRPPELTSDQYTREYLEVKALGSATSATRTAEQTETARFYSDHFAVQCEAALRDHVTRHQLDIVDSARYFAAAATAQADGVIAAWNAKLEFAYWRPITAIQLADTDGNPATEPDPAWQPLITNPPYPEYTSGLNSTAGALSGAARGILRSSHIDLNFASAVTRTTKHYDTVEEFRADAIESRIWGGVHFRAADVDGNLEGALIGRFVTDHYFRPTKD